MFCPRCPTIRMIASQVTEREDINGWLRVQIIAIRECAECGVLIKACVPVQLVKEKQ